MPRDAIDCAAVLRSALLSVLIVVAAAALAAAVGGVRGLAAATAAVLLGAAFAASAAHDRHAPSVQQAGEPIGERGEPVRVKRFGDVERSAQGERALAVRGGLGRRHYRRRDLG
jgi:hypothetical protein